MKISSLLAVVGSLLLATAEPIPVKARSALPSAKQIAEALGDTLASIDKRSLDYTNPYGDIGPRYWAWSKLAYDQLYNRVEGPQRLQGGQGTKWHMLGEGGSDIIVKGYDGRMTVSPWGGGWETFTGMRVTVGLDKEKQKVVMAFIGSNDKPTSKQDLKFFPHTDPARGITGKVETGFYEAFRSVQQKAFDWTKEWAEANPDYDIVITGHSLGGATAHIAAVAWAAENGHLLSRTHVFTYGAPRAGDLEFQQKLQSNQGDRMANFVHHRDLVPHVPPITSIGGKYANPARRFEYAGDDNSWSDASKWTLYQDADEQHRLWDGVVSVAADMLKFFAQHTNYFGSSISNSKRRVASFMPTANVRREASRLQKRDAPTSSDLQDASALVDEIKVQGQINPKYGPVSQLTNEMRQFTEKLHITGEQMELIEAIQEFQGEDERIELLRAIEYVAMDAQ